MQIYVEHLDLPYPPQLIFDLVADIESYPRFLPNVAAARISKRDGNTLWVEQIVGFKLLRLKFKTQAVLTPPSQIKVICPESSFGVFNEQWDFTPGPSGSTHLQCRAEYQFRSHLLELALNETMRDVLSATVKAFQQRARHLYGEPAASP
jgi:coenzyme Q-binding protein COQ10